MRGRELEKRTKHMELVQLRSYADGMASSSLSLSASLNEQKTMIILYSYLKMKAIHISYAITSAWQTAINLKSTINYLLLKFFVWGAEKSHRDNNAGKKSLDERTRRFQKKKENLLKRKYKFVQWFNLSLPEVFQYFDSIFLSWKSNSHFSTGRKQKFNFHVFQGATEEKTSIEFLKLVWWTICWNTDFFLCPFVWWLFRFY